MQLFSEHSSTVQEEGGQQERLHTSSQSSSSTSSSHYSYIWESKDLVLYSTSKLPKSFLNQVYIEPKKPTDDAAALPVQHLSVQLL